MAEGPSGPCIDSGYLYRQTMQAQGQGGSGTIYILGGISGQVDCFKGFSPQGNGIALFNPPKPLLVSQGRPKLADKIPKVLAEAFDAVSKMNRENMPQAAPIQPTSIADITGQSHGLGGGMTSMVASVGAPDDLSRG